jgi:hypothetical protein
VVVRNDEGAGAQFKLRPPRCAQGDAVLTYLPAYPLTRLPAYPLTRLPADFPLRIRSSQDQLIKKSLQLINIP